jgi:hypothetical protein
MGRRWSAGRTYALSTRLTPARALAGVTTEGAVVGRIVRSILPIELRYDRSMLGAFEASALLAPGARVQLGLAGLDAYRHSGDVPATSAGSTGSWSASGAVVLPLGFALANSWRRTDTRNWVRRWEGDDPFAVARVSGAQTIFPNAALRWGYRSARRDGWIEAADASAGLTRTDAQLSLPGPDAGSLPQLRRSIVRSTPVRAQVAWGFGSLTTGASWAATRRTDSLPGTISDSRAEESAAEVARTFTIPTRLRLDLRNPVRVRAGYQQTRTRTFVEDVLGTVRSRLQDNGRYSYNLAADTDLNETLVLTLQGSRVVTFDNNLNRRFAQTVLSTVLQIRFFGGKL